MLRWAVARPRVLLVGGADAAGLRWDVEAVIDRRGWRVARSPAETDLLVVCAPMGPETTAAVDLLWSQVPLPRHRVTLAGRPVEDQLDAAAQALLLPAAWQEDDRATPEERLGAGRAESPMQPDDGHEGHGGGHEGHDGGHETHGGGGHEGHGGGHDGHGGGHEGHGDGHEGHGGGHGGHGGGHEGHGGEVAGLPMAQVAEDRDGLALDQLAVRLGPVLPGWPTGLVLSAAMQGDVLTDVSLSWADAPGHHGPHADHHDLPDDPGHRRHEDTVGHPDDVLALDRLACFLLVAGWPTAARQAREARDGLRSPSPEARARARRSAAALTRRVERSRTLAWSVRGMAAVAPSTTAHAPPASAAQDVVDRVRSWCAAGRGEHADDRRPALTPAELAPALEGLELAAVRLAVASVVVDRTPTPVHAEHAHG